MADTDPDDLTAGLFALVEQLGEAIGRFPPHERNSVLNLLEVELRHYVSQIPPLPTDPYPGPDHAA